MFKAPDTLFCATCVESSNDAGCDLGRPDLAYGLQSERQMRFVVIDLKFPNHR
jgi:hypothetical protein